MFKVLKDKLKTWSEKLKPEEEEEKPKSKTSKKTKEKKETKKTTKKDSSKKEVKKKTGKKPVKKEKINKKEEVEEKESFFEKATKFISGKDTEEAEEKPEEAVEEEKKPKLDFLKKKLTGEKFDELFEELELILLQNNVAYEVVEKIKENLKEKIVGENLGSLNINDSLKESIEDVLVDSPDFVKEIKNSNKKPFVILFTGINGSGKTTTIARIAHLLKKEKMSVCLAAGDTFRAAAIEQLQQHADKLKVPIIKKEYNSDPAAVGFEAIKYAEKNDVDVVLIDTAGRLQNKDSLMREMEKISRVTNPDMKIFVGESITGNDATEQAKAFNDLIDLTGIILTKADVDEKGGTAISVSYITKKPILFLGVGQTYDDLDKFTKKKILDSLGL